MHHRQTALSIRSWADELPKPRFSCLPLQRSRAWTQKKELAIWIRFHSIQIQADLIGECSRIAAGSPNSVALQLFCRDWNLGSWAWARRTGWAVAWQNRILFPCDFMAYAVFVEFCSETQSQAITALFLVQISCSWRRATFDSTNFDRGAALEFTNSWSVQAGAISPKLNL